MGSTTRIENALKFRLSGLTLSPIRRVAWPGTAFTPEMSEIYLAPVVLWNRSERGEVGAAAALRHVGILQVDVRGPALADDEPQTEVVDSVIEWFDRQVITRNSVIVRIGSFNGGLAVCSRSGAIVSDGWRQISVSIPFWCDVFPS